MNKYIKILVKMEYLRLFCFCSFIFPLSNSSYFSNSGYATPVFCSHQSYHANEDDNMSPAVTGVTNRSIPSLYSGGTIALPGFPTARFSDEIHSHGKENSVNSNDLEVHYYLGKNQETNENKIRLSFTIPEGNLFYYDNPGRLIKAWGFLGGIIGLDYYSHNYHFYSIKLGILFDDPSPVPVSISYGCIYGYSSERFFQFQYNHVFPNYSIGYGFHWLDFRSLEEFCDRGNCYCDGDDVDIEEYDIRNQSFGLSFSISPRIGNHWYLDLNYMPTIFLRYSGEYHLNYSHTLYLGITFKTGAFRIF